MRKELQAELPCHRYPMPALSIEKENKTMTDYPNNIPAKLEIIKASEITPRIRNRMPLSSNSHQRLNIVSIIQKRFGSFFRISFSFNNFARSSSLTFCQATRYRPGKRAFLCLPGGRTRLPRESSADRFLFVSRLILIFVGCLTFKFESECRK